MKIFEKIKVNASTSYEVVVGENLIENSGEFLKSVTRGKKAFVLTDDIVKELYFDKLKRSLKENSIDVELFVIKNGEQSKSLEVFGGVLNAMAKAKLTRSDFLIALGGGVVGDLGGFVASCYMRGIDYVQIPTTLLSQIDSSVGGKTAVDLASGKNLVGTFYQPKIVLADTVTLKTLPNEIFQDGLGEMVKYAVLEKGEIFDIMKNKNILENLANLITLAIKIKRDIVEEDEFDNGKRMVLNLGHTLAHSIEKLSNFKIRHGLAVAIGLYIMAVTCEKNKMLTSGDMQEIDKMYDNLKLNKKSPFSISDMTKEIVFDKKAENANITLIVIKAIGDVVLSKMTLKKSEEFFNGYCED